MIYLEAPYTSDYTELERIAVRLLAKRMHVVSPLLHWRPRVAPSDQWQPYCYDLLISCETILVACLPGWRGNEDVLRLAARLAIPLRYVDPVSLEITDTPVGDL